MKEFKFGQPTQKAVVTRAKDGYDLAVLTHPFLDAYAKKCGADFLVLNEEIIKTGDYAYEILQFHSLFDKYDCILSVDSDAIVTESCPDIFQMVPQDEIASVYEDKYSRKKDRRRRIAIMQEKFGDVGWREGYINTGFFLASAMHKEIFAYDKSMLWNSYGLDDVYLGYRIHKMGFKIRELPCTFNHMSAFSELGQNWLKSHVIHYAGRGFGKTPRSQQIKEDLEMIRTKTPVKLNFCRLPERLRLIALGLYRRVSDLAK